MVGALSDKSGLLGAEPSIMPMGDRLAFAAGDGLSVALVMWLLVLPLPGVWALFSRLRGTPVMRAAAAYAFGMPLVAMLSAPAVATYGSIYRSSSALVPLLAAVSALSLAALARWFEDRFEQPGWMLPGFLMVLWVGTITVAGPLKSAPTTPLGEAECALLGQVDTPLFTADPLYAAERCEVRAVLHSAYQDPEARAELGERFGIRWALAPRASDERGHAMHEMDPGWVEVSPRLWRFQPTQ